MSAITTQTLTLCMMMALGFLAARMGWLTKTVRSGLTSLLINIATPCVIVRSFQQDSGIEVWRGMLITAVVLTISMLLGIFLGPKLLRRESTERRATLVFGMSLGNMGFMGIPVIGAYVGEGALIYVSVAIAMFNVVCWTLGVRLFDPDAFRPGKMLRFPCLYAVVIGLALFAFRIPIPHVLDSVLEMAGSINSPLAMMLVGAVIAESSFASFFNDHGALIATVVRLVIYPAAALCACILFHIEGTLRTVLVLLNGMPSAINTALLSAMYGGDDAAAGHLVGMSTLMYLPIVFLWTLALGIC